MTQNSLINSSRELPEEPSCEIHALAKEKSFEDFSNFSSGGHLVQWHKTVWSILVESYPRNLPEKLFQNLSTELAEEVV